MLSAKWIESYNFFIPESYSNWYQIGMNVFLWNIDMLSISPPMDSFAKNYKSLCCKGCQFSESLDLDMNMKSSWHQITCVTQRRKSELPTLHLCERWAALEGDIPSCSKLFEQARNVILIFVVC